MKKTQQNKQNRVDVKNWRKQKFQQQASFRSFFVVLFSVEIVPLQVNFQTFFVFQPISIVKQVLFRFQTFCGRTYFLFKLSLDF